MFFAKFSPWNLGRFLRLSSASNSSKLLIWPAKNPRPIGENATTDTPSSRQVSKRPLVSISKVHGLYDDVIRRTKVDERCYKAYLYSTWTAVIGCTLWARRRVSAEHSDKPRYFTFPCSTSFAMAATVVSIGLRRLMLFKRTAPNNDSVWLNAYIFLSIRWT